MKECLLSYFVADDTLKNNCDFSDSLFPHTKTIYEVLRVINGKPLFLEDHIQRLFDSASLVDLNTNITGKQIKSNLHQLIESNQLKAGNIHFQLSEPNFQQPHFFAWITPSFYPPDEFYQNGVEVKSLEFERSNPNAKSDHSLARIQANEFINQKDIFEALLVDQSGNITEGSRSNVFFVKENLLFTPPLSSVLPGVTRSKIIQLASKLSTPCVETSIPQDQTKKFDAAFLSGTSIKILPIRQVDNLQFKTKNKLVSNIIYEYQKCINSHIADFKW